MATVPDAVRTTPVAAPAPGRAPQMVAFLVMVGFFAVAPFFVYPVFLMKALCFALFACAFNLLIGYVGLLSFGHAVYLGAAGYAAAYAAKAWGWPPELAVLGGTDGGVARGHAGGRSPRTRYRRHRHPPAGHLLRDDHARAGPDDLLLLPAGAVHR